MAIVMAFFILIRVKGGLKMGEKYDFPTSQVNLKRLAQQAIDSQDWETASQIYQQVYQNAPSFLSNQQLVALLAQNQQFQMAYAIQTEYLSDYKQASANVQQQAFKRVLAANQFIAAYRWLTWLPETEKTAALVAIQQAEQQYQQNAQATILQLEKELFHIDEQPVYQQLILLRQAQQLPLHIFETVMQRLLVNPFLNPLMRATSLEVLVQINNTQTYSFYTIDKQQILVKPAVLCEILQVPVIQNLKQQLATDEAIQDPIMVQSIQETIDLHAAYLYPLASQIITAPENWLLVYQYVYQQEKVELTTKQQQILEWQQRLDHFTAQLNL